MAVKTWLATISSSWGASANWSGPTVAIPTAADDLIFGSTSPGCVVDIASPVCRSIDFTSYSGTITMSNAITVGQTTAVTSGATAGYLYLGSSMGITGAAGITLRAITTNPRFDLRSNGRTWPNNLTTGSLVSTQPFYNFLDNWTIGGTFTIGNINGSANITSFNIVCLGNLRMQGAASGILLANTPTTKIILGGTCTWSCNPSGVGGTQLFRTNVSIDIDSGPSTVTIADGVTWAGTGGTSTRLRYVSGTVIHPTGATFYIQAANGANFCTFDLNGSTSPGASSTSTGGVNFQNVQLRIASQTGTSTLSTPIRVLGNFSTGGNAGQNVKSFQTVLNGSQLIMDGNLTHAGGRVFGTTLFLLGGTGTWTEPGGNFGMGIGNPITINTPGTITIQGNVYIAGSFNWAFTYTAGNVNASGATIGIIAAGTAETLQGCSNFYIGNLWVAGTNNLNYSVRIIDTQNLSVGTVGITGLNSTNSARFTGNAGFTASYFDLQIPSSALGGKVIDLVSSGFGPTPSVSYHVKSGIVMKGFVTTANVIYPAILRCSNLPIAGRAFFSVADGATMDLYASQASRINASLGQTLRFRPGSIIGSPDYYGSPSFYFMNSYFYTPCINCEWMKQNEVSKIYITE